MENATLGQIQIGDRIYERQLLLQAEGGGGQAAMRHAHANRLSIACLCRGPANPVAMHIAKRGALYFLRRNPGTAHLHDKACDAARNPLSDLTQQFGADAAHETTTGNVVLRLAERLSEGAKRPQKLDPKAKEQLQVTSSHRGGQITELSLLRYLWAESDLARWHPAMTGKRTWGVARHQLEAVLKTHWFGRTSASSQTFIPFSFALSRVEQGDPYREAVLRVSTMMDAQYEALTERTANSAMPVMHVIAPLRSLSPEAGSVALTLTHMPELEIHDSNNVIARFEASNHRAIVRATSPNTRTKLILMLRVVRDEEGRYLARSIAGMETSAEYLPFKNKDQAQLVLDLIDEQRAFKVNITAPSTEDPFVHLLDTGSETPLYIGSQEATSANAWCWDIEINPEPPKFPPPTTQGIRHE